MAQTTAPHVRAFGRSCVRSAERIASAPLMRWGLCAHPVSSDADAFVSGAVSLTMVPEKCMVLDDQLAFIPARYAAAYFGGTAYTNASASNSASLNNTTAVHYLPMVAGNAACQWPEGMVTCRLLEAGARLGMLALDVELHIKRNAPSARWQPGQDAARDDNDNDREDGPSTARPLEAASTPLVWLPPSQQQEQWLNGVRGVHLTATSRSTTHPARE